MNLIRFVLLVMLFNGSIVWGQKLKVTSLLEDDISIRAMEIVDGKVYYVGTNSKFGYVDIATPSVRKQVRISKDTLQFRTLAFDGVDFYTINITSPAHFFRINKGTLNSTIMHTDYAPNAFYDALIFDRYNFYTFSDPDDNLRLKWIKFNAKPYFSHTTYSTLEMKKGEAAFAASNGNIAFSDTYVWLATGGMVSRIYRLNKIKESIEVFTTPFVQGTSTKGMYAIDFYDDDFGIAVGGDYTQQSENINTIATTHDGGETWQIKASGKNLGYKTCVRIRPNSKGKDIIAVGDNAIEFSRDFGETWRSISDEKGIYVARWQDENTLILAGKDKILKFEF